MKTTGLVLALALAALVGCGPSAPPTSRVAVAKVPDQHAKALIPGKDLYSAPKRHWIDIADRYHGTSVCVLDSTEKIVAYAKERFPNLEPGIWYAEDGEEKEWGRFASKTLAKRESERHLGGCPSYTPIDIRNQGSQ